MNNKGPFEVIYVTGAPATGKSTLVANLRKRIVPLEVYTYSKILADYVGQKYSRQFSENQMREQSAKLITPADVKTVDEYLVESVKAKRDISHVVIDSHPVTKEDYGFRVTPFTLSLLSAISPTLICVLYAESNVVIERIKSNRQGRPIVSTFEADFHCNLQASVAISYSIQLGVPVFFYNSDKSPDSLADEITLRITRN